MGTRGGFFRSIGLSVLLALTGCSAPVQQLRSAGVTAALKQHVMAPPSKPASSLVEESNVLELPRPVTNFGATVHDGALYLYGGYFGAPGEYTLEGQSGELLRIDLETQAIQSLAQGIGVQGAPLVSSDAGLLRVGGMRAENIQGEPERVVSLAEIARFDGDHGRWVPFALLPQARSSHTALVHRDKLYVIGGFTLSGIRDTGVFNQDMLVLDLQSGQWRSIPQPFRARALAAGVLNDRLVVAGGLTENGKISSEVHVFDPASESWSRAADYPQDTFGIAIASTGTHLYGNARDGIVYELSADQRTWSKVSALAFPRFSHQLVALDDAHVWALGGLSSMYHGDHVSHIEQLDVNDTEPRVLRWSLRDPLRTQEELAVQVVDDALLVFAAQRPEAPQPAVASTDAFSLELASLRAQAIEPLPRARPAAQTAALEGQVLALGGAPDGVTGDGFVFDVASGHWLAYPSALPEPRSGFAMVERDAEVWVLGGQLAGQGAPKASRQVLRARPGEPFVENDVGLPRARAEFGAALLNDQLFTVGGLDERGAPVDQCDALSISRKAWSTFPCPKTRVAPELVALGGKLYMAGGSAPPDGVQADDSLEVYDPASNSWSTLLAHAPVSAAPLRMRVYHHALLMFGRAPADGRLQLALVVPAVRS